ncbi:hypothetical protein ES705_18119 [subsurface metagenome]
MAYELTIDKTYPEGESYTGRAERFDAYLQGPPGWLEFGIFDDIIAQVIEWFPPEGADKLIRIRIWRDDEPFWTTLFKVEVIGHGSPISWALIAVALAAIIGIAVISWNMVRIDWKAAAAPLIGLGIGLLALALILAIPKRKGKEE